MKNTKFSLLTKFIIVFLVSVFLASVCATAVFAATYPKPTDNVADEAGVLSESTIRQIKTANKTLSIDTKTSIAVCTVATTGDTDIADYARGVFKEWKMGEGVLLLVAVEDKNYYFVQSTGVENVLTNDVLAEIRDEYLEDDFANGEIERGVNKCVVKLKTVLTTGIKAENAAEEENSPSDENGTGIGGVIVGFFKALLYIILALIVIAIVLFVAALFNDDVAAIVTPIIARLRGKALPTRMPEEYYDERLYGKPSNSGNRAPRNQIQGYRGQNQLPQGNRNPRQPQNRQQNQDGNYPAVRRENPQNYTNRQSHNDQQYYGNQPRRQQSYDYRGQRQNPQQRPVQYRQYQQQNQDFGDETRAFTIPNSRRR